MVKALFESFVISLNNMMSCCFDFVVFVVKIGFVIVVAVVGIYFDL